MFPSPGPLSGHVEVVRFLLEACKVNPTPRDRWVQIMSEGQRLLVKRKRPTLNPPFHGLDGETHRWMRRCFSATMMLSPSCSSTRNTTARLKLLMAKRGRRRAWTACSRTHQQNLQRLLHRTFHEAKIYIYRCSGFWNMQFISVLFKMVCSAFCLSLLQCVVCELLNTRYLNICDLVFTVSVYCSSSLVHILCQRSLLCLKFALFSIC